MIRWAKAKGAEWFDMGGVTLEGAAENALEGISHFKRNFSRNVVEVGSEWAIEPALARAKLAAVLSMSASHLRGLMRKRR
jgi:lipid II:glycine glycyltransferase (peptidoglycan interpeptide bridge formation enzyme)